MTAHPRLDHPDFWLLSEVVLDHFARQRALRAVQAGLVEPSAEPAPAAIRLDGLVAGMLLQAKKDQET